MKRYRRIEVLCALGMLLAGGASVRGEGTVRRHGGRWTLRDGAVWVDGGPGPKLVAEGARIADGQAGVEVYFPDKRAGNAGLILRVSEAGVGADAFVGYEVALHPSRGMLRVGRHRHNFHLIRDVPTAVPIKTWIPIVVTLRGGRIDVDVSGKRIASLQDPRGALPAGAVGLRPWQRPAGFRNLWVTRSGRRQAIQFGKEHVDPPPPPGPSIKGLGPVVLFTRHPLTPPNAINCDIWQTRPAKGGCSIRIYQPGEPMASAKTIFRDPSGCIYDMNLSRDAKTVYFSFRPKGDRYWHIYRVGTGGKGLRQLTRGPHYDISPVELPGGDLLMVSTRRGGYTLCQPGPASNLHRMAADGTDIRCVSMNTLADFSPHLLADGRVLFTRWEYIDRDLTYRQSLWTQNPNGTGYQLYFGNTVRDVGTFWQARPLPGDDDTVVATFAPHHGWPHGAIGLIRTRHGVEGPRGVGFEYITKEFPTIQDRRMPWAYRDPCPVSDDTFLASYGGGANRFRIFLLSRDDRKTLVYEDPAISCFGAIPLRPRPVPPAVPDMRVGKTQWGTALLTDVYRGLTGIERGRVKKLRIMEQVRKAEDLVSRAYDQSPVMSYATYYAKRTWGEVDVAADGSAYFQAPALREIYFQALDDQGRELQRMTSATQVMPGQYVSCIGCHEPRGQAPTAGRRPTAARGQPAKPVMPAWAPDGIIDFCRVVQPVLDKYCVRCHSGPAPKAGQDLSGDKTRLFNMAYDNLLGRSRSYRQHDMFTGAMLPREKARGKPLVHFYWLLRTPSGVNQPLWTGCHASRLPHYFESDHCERKIPLADRQRVYMWIDANVPYYGTYAHSRPKSPGRRDLCTDADTGRPSAWFAKGFLSVYNRRCRSCHNVYPHPNDHNRIWDGRYAWMNLTRPEWSAALTAHLAKAAGGRGTGTEKGGKGAPLFKDAKDPDYLAMLRAIQEGRRKMLAHPRVDRATSSPSPRERAR